MAAYTAGYSGPGGSHSAPCRNCIKQRPRHQAETAKGEKEIEMRSPTLIITIAAAALLAPKMIGYAI
jgi:hypothetical protein